MTYSPFHDIIQDRSHEYMALCIEIAKQTPSFVHRPYVGTIILDAQERIVGEGYKQFVPERNEIKHAERAALDIAGECAQGALLFTTLEPCMRPHRRYEFMSSADYIIKSGIDTVVFGFLDNSTKMSHYDTASYLERNGVIVIQFTPLNKRIQDELMRPDCRDDWPMSKQTPLTV